MMRIALGLIWIFVGLSACKANRERAPDSEVKSSGRNSPTSVDEVMKLPFDFCPEKRSMSLNNAFWLSYFAASQYNHFKEVGPLLGKLGFGDEGEGFAFVSKWWTLRIKRVKAGIKDTDDTWSSPEGKAKREGELLASYKLLTNKDYVDDGSSAQEYEAKLVGGNSPGAKIQFFSSLVAGGEITASTQAFYAEHNKLNLSIVSFRGTETDEDLDKKSDLVRKQIPLDGLGQVHKGFYDAYMAVDKSLIESLRQRSKIKPMNLWVTGHSLGAAVATIFVARVLQLQAQGDLKAVHLIGAYHIGSPRVFNAEGSKKFNALLTQKQINYLRFRNNKDIVTGIPFGIPGVMAPYWHVGALGYFSADGHLSYGDGWKSIEEDSDLKQSFPTEVKDHDAFGYWNLISKAKSQALDPATVSCDSKPNEKPLLPFVENPADR